MRWNNTFKIGDKVKFNKVGIYYNRNTIHKSPWQIGYQSTIAEFKIIDGVECFRRTFDTNCYFKLEDVDLVENGD